MMTIKSGSRVRLINKPKHPCNNMCGRAGGVYQYKDGTERRIIGRPVRLDNGEEIFVRHEDMELAACGGMPLPAAPKEPTP